MGPARTQVGNDLGQVVLEVGVVDAVAEEHVAERRVRAHGRLGAQDLLDPVGGVGAGLGLLGPARVAERGGGAVVDRLRQRQHLGAVGSDPAEAPAEALALVAQAAREHERVQAEPAQDLRQLRRVAEAVGQVADGGRAGAVALAHQAAVEQVAHQRLGADEELVGQRVAGAGVDPPGPQQRAQAVLQLGPDLQVVLEQDRPARRA